MAAKWEKFADAILSIWTQVFSLSILLVNHKVNFKAEGLYVEASCERLFNIPSLLADTIWNADQRITEQFT